MLTPEDIAGISLFYPLPERHRKTLATIAQRQSLSSGEVLFSDGDEATGFYAIESGRLKVFKLSPDGKEQILHLFGAGEIVGEVAVFTGSQYPAHAAALEPCRLLHFPKHAFLEIVSAEPALALELLAELSRRLRRFTRLVEDLSLKEVPSRLAAHLVLLCDQQGSDEVVIDVTKAQLAAHLGTIPETLSRILARMAQGDLIELQGRRSVIVRNRPELEKLALGDRRL